MTVSHGSQARTTDFSRVDINTGKFVHAVSVYCTVYCCVLSSKEKNMLKNEKVSKSSEITFASEYIATSTACCTSGWVGLECLEDSWDGMKITIMNWQEMSGESNDKNVQDEGTLNLWFLPSFCPTGKYVPQYKWQGHVPPLSLEILNLEADFIVNKLKTLFSAWPYNVSSDRAGCS